MVGGTADIIERAHGFHGVWKIACERIYDTVGRDIFYPRWYCTYIQPCIKTSSRPSKSHSVALEEQTARLNIESRV